MCKSRTKDHSIIQLLIDADEITVEEAATHPSRGQTTRSVGMESEPPPDTRLVGIKVGDRMLLCTDGLTGMLSDEEILSVLRSGSTPPVACHRLIHAANEAGGKDNTTAIVLQVVNTSTRDNNPRSSEKSTVRDDV